MFSENSVGDAVVVVVVVGADVKVVFVGSVLFS